MRKTSITLLLSMALAHVIYAQSPWQEPPRLFTMRWANDAPNKHDRYFSNGLFLSFTTPGISRSPLDLILPRKKPRTEAFYGFSIKHHLFTPSVKSSSIDEADRPYASYLLLGHHKIVVNPDTRVRKTGNLEIGVIGKYAGARSIQNGFHKLINNDPVEGWENQIGSDLAISYQFIYEKGIVNLDWLELNALAEFNLGVPYTNIMPAVRLRLGWLHDYFTHLGLSEQQPCQLYFFTTIGNRFVAYNATLQGGVFNEGNVHELERPNRSVYEIQAGITMVYRFLQIEVGQHHINREFQNALKHSWSYAALTFIF